MKPWLVLLLLLPAVGYGADSAPVTGPLDSSNTPPASPSKAPVARVDWDWAQAGKILGRPGQAQGEGTLLLFPRTDLNVMVQGFPLDSATILVSRFSFQPVVQGPAPTAPKEARMMGRIYLLDPEVPQALSEAARSSLKITALYSPFLEESPALKCLRLEGDGTLSNLAWAAKMVLSATGTPLTALSTRTGPTPTAFSASSQEPNGWEEVQDLLGPGEEKGPTLLYEWEGNGRELSLAFQNYGKDTVALGEWTLPQEETQALVEGLLQRHITVTSVSTDYSGGDTLGFVDFWVVGDGKKLAGDFEGILAEEKLLNP